MNRITLHLAALAALLLLPLSSQAANLLVNGDFETGSLSPWSASNAAIATSGGGQVCDLNVPQGFGANASIVQTVTTKSGASYFLGFQVSGAAGASVVGAAGPSGNAAITDGQQTLTGSRIALTFTASSTSTLVRIAATSLVGFQATVAVDNVVLLELAPVPQAGRYSGLALTETSKPESGLLLKTPAKVVARLDATGRIVILQGASVLTGLVLPDNTFLLLTGGTAVQGTALFKGARVTLSYDASASVQDLNNNQVPYTQTISYVLTKAGK